jgi:Flp pilus assembly protein TadG
LVRDLLPKTASGSEPLFLCLKKRKYLMKMLRAFLTGWVRKEEGTTAIEFALMAIPYIILTLGIIELSLMYAAATLLEGATSSASRMIRTGQIQTQGDPEGAFRTALCEYATVLIRCNDVVIEVQQLASFDDYDDMQPEFDEDGNMVSSGFDAGSAESRLLIRVSYRYTMLDPFVGMLLAGPTNSRLFMSTIVLQNEPYDTGEDA